MKEKIIPYLGISQSSIDEFKKMTFKQWKRKMLKLGNRNRRISSILKIFE